MTLLGSYETTEGGISVLSWRGEERCVRTGRTGGEKVLKAANFEVSPA
jgi:hypothetical protein